MQHSSSWIKWALWSLAALFYFYEFLLRVSPSVMVPELMSSFGVTASVVGVLSASYLYAYAPMQLPVGLLMDRYGLKRILTLASLACGVGALLFAMAEELWVAGCGRLLIGASSAFGFVAMVYVSSHWFPTRKRAFLIGMANSIAMLGASAGTGPLTNSVHDYGWRSTMGVFGLFGVLLAVAICLVLRCDQRDIKVEGEIEPAKVHLLEHLKQVARRGSSWVNGMVAMLFYMTTTAFAGLWGLSFVETAYGVSKEMAGYAMSMVFAGWLVGGPLTGLLSDLIGTRTMTLRLGIVGVLACLVPVLYFPSIPIYAVYILLFLVGFFSSAELLNFSLAIELNSTRAKATAAAFTNCLISLGDAVIQPLVGFLLDYNWSGMEEQGIRIYGMRDYQLALSCLPITLILAFLLLFLLREKPQAAH